MTIDLPPKPHILDIGSGPGMQTMELAQISDGNIVAVDTHQPFLDELERRVQEQGLSDRVKTVNASMFELPFGKESFDLIWAEGAMYFMGFRNALNAWKELLAPRGYIVVTEPSWLKTEIPDEVKAHWAEYPGMLPIEGTRKIIGECDFEEIGHFVLPDASWWEEYYNPQEQKLKTLKEKYKDNPDALAQVAETQKEIDIHRKYGDLYGYVFFVMQKKS